MNKTRTTKPYLKLTAYMLSAAALLLPVGSVMHAEAETDAVDIWSTYATEKVLQDKTDGYDAVRRAARVSVNACQGEYESTQLILTAKEDISSYNVEVSDLTDGAGNTFDAENILVYHEKYIEVKETFEDNAETGMYPDALLPIEKAVEYGENTISAGNNQGVYITFNVPADQAAGTYTGTMKVTYDGAQASVPVTLGVNDILVSQTTHTQSKFNVTFAHWLGELNSTQDMLDSYISVMAEHRISPGLIMFGNDSNYNADSIAAYAEKAYELLQENPKMSTFAVPTPTMTDSSTGLPTLNGDTFGEYLNAIIDVALKSYDAEAETGFDLMSYAICTVSIIDEPDLNDTLNRVPGVAEQFEGAISGAKAYLETQAAAKGVSDAFVQEIETSLDNFPLIVSLTTTWTPADEETQKIITLCPQINLYDSASQRAVYAQQQQRWIYTCNQPHSPYPTYHIDDTLVSARSLSWMMSEYDITGNFYWAADLYQQYVGNGTYQPIDDYYGTAERYENANGDGYLMYPGAPYGMDEPLSSLRLEAIRDGLEEYELWYALHDVYEAKGYSYEDIQRKVSSLIYQGAKVVSTSERMQFAREAVIRLLELAESLLSVGITDVEENGASVTYTVRAASGSSLTVPENAGITFTGENGTWEVTVDTSKAAQLSFTVTNGQETETFTLAENTVSVFDAAALNADIAQGGGTLTKNVVSGSAYGAEGSVLKLDIAAVTNANQYVTLGGAAIAAIDADTKTVVFNIYNASEQEQTFRVMARFTNSSYGIEVSNAKLVKGWNKIEIVDISQKMGGGALQSLSLYFTNLAANYAEKTVVFGTMTVYGF